MHGVEAKLQPIMILGERLPITRMNLPTSTMPTQILGTNPWTHLHLVFFPLQHLLPTHIQRQHLLHPLLHLDILHTLLMHLPQLLELLRHIPAIPKRQHLPGTVKMTMDLTTNPNRIVTRMLGSIKLAIMRDGLISHKLHLLQAPSCATLAIASVSTMFSIKQMTIKRAVGKTAAAYNSSKQLDTVFMQ